MSHVFAKEKPQLHRPDWWNGVLTTQCTVEHSRETLRMESVCKIKLNIQNNPNKYAKLKSWLDCTCNREFYNIQIISNIQNFNQFNQLSPVEIIQKCSRPILVLPFAAHCICFHSNVLIIPQHARVGGLLTHARAIDRPSRCRPEPHLFLSLHADKSVAQPPTPPKHIACTPEDSHVQKVFMNDPLSHCTVNSAK